MRKIHGYQSKMLWPQTNSMSSIRYTLVLHARFIQWPSNPSCPMLQGRSMLAGGDVRGHPISHFRCSKFHPTPRLELHPALLFESELHSTFTSRVTVDVK